LRNCLKLGEIALSLVFPRRCPICDKPVKPFGRLACTECEEGKIGYVHGPVCYKCGKPLDDGAKEYCEDCISHHHLYERGLSLFEYKTVAESIYRFKYKGRREYSVWYGEQIEKYLGDKILDLKPDVLVPVPIHASKLRKRGYNQASLIAHEVSKRLGIPVKDDCVIREKKTTPLKDLTPLERNNILRGAFKIGTFDVKLRTIVIIDDIYTTGATIDAVARPLLSAGATRIYFVTLAIGSGI